MTFWDILSLGQLSFDHLGNRPGPFAPLPQSSPALRPRILWKGLHVLPLPRSSATLPDPSDKSYGFCIIKRLSWFQRLRGLRFREPRWRPSRRPSPPLAIGINLLYVCLLADNTCVSSYELKNQNLKCRIKRIYGLLHTLCIDLWPHQRYALNLCNKHLELFSMSTTYYNIKNRSDPHVPDPPCTQKTKHETHHTQAQSRKKLGRQQISARSSWVKVVDTSAKWWPTFGSTSLGRLLHRDWKCERTRPFPGEAPLACGNSSGLSALIRQWNILRKLLCHLVSNLLVNHLGIEHPQPVSSRVHGLSHQSRHGTTKVWTAPSHSAGVTIDLICLPNHGPPWLFLQSARSAVDRLA